MNNFLKNIFIIMMSAFAFAGCTGDGKLMGTIVGAITGTNDITISNLQTSNISSTRFDASIDFTGDENSNAIAQVCFCNETDSSSCDAMAGTCSAMSRGSSSFTGSVTGLTAPNDVGDVLNVAVVATDADGTSGSPLTSQVTLTAKNDIEVSNLQTSNVSSTRFDTSIDYFGDDNANSSAQLCFCNDTDSGSCLPSGGTCVAMDDDGTGFSKITSGLTAPNDPGDVLNIEVTVTDADGITGSPLATQVTLAAVNAITISNLQTSNITPGGFNISADFSGDDNADGTAQFCYCNETDSASCDPLAGTCSALTKNALDFTATLSGLTTPNDPGDVLNVAVSATDADGTSGSPLTTQVTLPLLASLTKWNDASNGTAYEIWNEDQLRDIGISACNASTATACAANFILMADLDLSSGNFIPIAGPSGTNNFSGEFDGNNKTIINVNIDINESYMGFFRTNNGSFIHDLDLTATVKGADRIGVLLGSSGPTTIDNVTVRGSVNRYNSGPLGGLAGSLGAGTITNSTAYVDVLASQSSIGGMVGRCTGCTISNSKAYGRVHGYVGAGGLVGAGDGIIIGSASFGDVSSDNGDVGGLVGHLYGNSSSVTDSYARGNVSTTADYAGGLVGRITTGSPKTITNCYASGDVKGANYVGGLVGQADSAGSRVISNSSAYGYVTGSGNYVGGFAGSVANTTITGSQAHGNVYGASTMMGGFIGIVETTASTIQHNSYMGELVSGGASTNYVGGFIGYNAVSSTIDHNYVRGWPKVTGSLNVGGFIGRSNWSFSHGYVEAHVSGHTNSGGLVGQLASGGSNSFVKATVTSSTSGAGGVAGLLNTNLLDVGAIATVNGVDKVGGVVGDYASGTVTNVYVKAKVVGSTNVYGLAGTGAPTFSNTYWDSDLTSLNAYNGATIGGNPPQYDDLTSAQMKTQANFNTWDFDGGGDWTSTDTVSVPMPKWLPESKCRDSIAISSAYNSIGSGTNIDPWLICNKFQWEDLVTNACGSGTTTHCDKFFALGADIDFEHTWPGQIAQADPNCFTGSFDGNNFTVSNLFYNFTVDDMGLFRCVRGKVRNIKFKNAHLRAANNRGLITPHAYEEAEIANIHVEGISYHNAGGNNGARIGGVVGVNTAGLVTHSSFAGSITSQGYTGGIVGESDHADSMLSYSKAFASLDVYSTSGVIHGVGVGLAPTDDKNKVYRTVAVGDISVTTGGNAGGVAGFQGTVTESAAFVNVNSGGNSVGGIFGRGTVDRSYNMCSSIHGNDIVGGAVGEYSFVTNSYSVVDTLTETAGTPMEFGGASDNPVSNSYYDSDLAGTSVQNTAGKVEPRTTAQMTDDLAANVATNYVGWDFTDIWFMGDGVAGGNTKRPMLRWMYHPACIANAEATAFNDIGSGTAEDPWKICFKEQLMDINPNACGAVSTHCDKHYELLADIDLANDTSFEPISTSTNAFSGSFNGNNYTISRLKIDAPGGWYKGLFARTSPGAIIQNLNLVAIDITTNGTSGGLVAFFDGGRIENVYVTGKITTNGAQVGGMAGQMAEFNPAIIINSGASVNITAQGAGGIDRQGGFVGYMYPGSEIYNSYATGDVTTPVDNGTGIGGFIGYSAGGIIKSSYASGDVNAYRRAGGFIGTIGANTTITESYALGDVTIATYGAGGFLGATWSVTGTVISNSFARGNVSADTQAGGFVGSPGDNAGNIYSYNYSTGTVSATSDTPGGFSYDLGTSSVFNNNYWDSDTSGITSGGVATKAEARTTVELQDDSVTAPGDASRYGPSWNFTNKWYKIDDQYPRPRF